MIATAEASSNLARYDGVRFGGNRAGDNGSIIPDAEDVRLGGDAASFHARIKAHRSRIFGPEVQRRLLAGSFVLSASASRDYYASAQAIRERVRAEFCDAFKRFDAILAPTSATLPRSVDEAFDADPVVNFADDVMTVTANLAGIPAMSLPFRGASVQLMSSHGDEATMLRVAAALERL